MSAPRVLIWVQHLLGTGHTVRAAAVGRALLAHGADVLMVLGGRPPPTLDLGDLRVEQLPPVFATDATFQTIVGEDGTPYAALQHLRREAFARAARDFAPDAVLLETFPLGRNMMAGEVEPVVTSLQLGEHPPYIACSVRDVLARKAPEKAAAMVARAEGLVDCVLCHGDPAFVPLTASFPAARRLGARLRYTGYVDAGAAPTRNTEANGEIVLSAGGGRSATGLVRLAVEAAALLGETRRWRMLVPQPDAVRAELGRPLPEHVALERNRSDFRALLSGAALSVSQAGYNTVVDVMVAGCRALFVPFADAGETEQTDRAGALAARGMARVVAADAGPQALAEAVDAALADPAPQRPLIDRDGADRAATMLIEAARAPSAKGPA